MTIRATDDYPTNRALIFDDGTDSPSVVGFLEDHEGNLLKVSFEADGTIRICSDGREQISITKHTARMIANLSDMAAHFWIDLQAYRVGEKWVGWRKLAVVQLNS
ncbi:hypothetical protein ABDF71_24380 [Ochrobactrum sp. WV_118_8]|uniref:hypothetical protein n=1 Tax=Ochrobactrum sp. A-1 TaxID=2920940 RepID=UPI001F0B5FEC|nr:hypothetical protein [Ochrobactrum sp. A-1]